MSSETLVITDSNVIVLMVITGLHKEICEAKHFGKIAAPPSIELELREWTANDSKKRKKFGNLVDDIYAFASEITEKELINVDQAKIANKKSQIKMAFRSLQNSGKSRLGAPPSETDTSLLAIAMITDSRLCTQEKTLRSLTSEMTDKDPIGFVELLVALIVHKQKSKDEVIDALENLDLFKENLSSEDYAKIEAL
jgi:hypothetical protein